MFETHDNAYSTSADTILCKQDSMSLFFFHQKIEQIVKNQPDAIALRHTDSLWTYQDLNETANQFGHYLQTKSVKSEEAIVVCLEPCPEIVVCLLGILKAGAIYVPLDPSYPQGRIQTILGEIRPKYIITTMKLRDELSLSSHPLILLEDIPSDSPKQNLETVINEHQTAYIFFTSGSTGQPKGVMASHANLAHYTESAVNRYQMNTTTIMPTIARFSFSISLFELLCPLVAGGSTYIISREDVMNMETMVKILTQVTMFHAGPSLLKKLLPFIHENVDDFSIFKGIHHASSGGDMIPPETLNQLRSIFSKAEVFVIYGSTEIACMGCTYEVNQDEITKTYVGKPFKHMQVRIIDDSFNELPAGVPGEVCFHGAGVAKGYLNHPELTKEKFRLLDDGKCYYRMGDLGCINSDGDLELLGRVDFQIKIRGMRVELAEVEYLLRKSPNVKDAVVAGWDLGNGDKTLIAYLVFETNATKNIREISDNLKYHLPDYMIPSAYVELSNLPLNFNMKLDRKALPDPRTMELLLPSRSSIRLPMTKTEQGIANLFQELLNVDAVGLDDNFFDLGGYSSIAIELIIKIQSTFHVSLEGLNVLRETVEVLATIIDKKSGIEFKAKAESNHVQNSSLIKVDSFYFGPEDSLYGILQRPEGQMKMAIVVCSPLPYEDDRLDFVLNRLAHKLTSQGIGLLQFHYSGTRNSLGENVINSFQDWSDNIATAINELQIRFQISEPICMGIRFGANLLLNTAKAIHCKHIILWDPIFDGTSYLKALEKTHKYYMYSSMLIKNLRAPLLPKNAKELLGATYTHQALNELSNINLDASLPIMSNISWFASTEIDKQRQTFNTMCSKQKKEFIVLSATNDFDWLRSCNQIPDTNITEMIAVITRTI